MPGGGDQLVDRGRGESLREHRRLGEVEKPVAGRATLPDRHVEHDRTVLRVRKAGCDGGHSGGVDVGSTTLILQRSNGVHARCTTRFLGLGPRSRYLDAHKRTRREHEPMATYRKHLPQLRRRQDLPVRRRDRDVADLSRRLRPALLRRLPPDEGSRPAAMRSATITAPMRRSPSTTGLGFILETPTWRANPDWAAKLGYARGRRSPTSIATRSR